MIRKKVFLITLIALTLSVMFSFEYYDTNTLRVVPQPVRTVANVSSDYAIERIEVYNLLGNLVLYKDGDGSLDFSSLQAGYYILKAYTAKGEYVKRVQKL